jgi:RNA polymerase sigma-70 factor (ECF subfamily)
MESTDISALYRRFGFVIYRRCRKLLRDSEQARDAAQEVFVRAVRHRERLTFDRECLPWLYRVATNYCLNLIRDKKLTRHVLAAQVTIGGADSQPESLFLARERIATLLDQLDETSSQIVIYYYMDSMTQEEIAGVMGLSRRTVGKKLKRFSAAVDKYRSRDKEA